MVAVRLPPAPFAEQGLLADAPELLVPLTLQSLMIALASRTWNCPYAFIARWRTSNQPPRHTQETLTS
eukprot:12507760-Alexandrium_andersonii.AAC.1